MPRSRFFLALLAVTGIGVAARHTVSGGADAGTAPMPPARAARLAGVDRTHPVADEGAVSFARATVAAPHEPEGLALARVAANHGSRLLESALKQPNDRRLLAEAAAHLKACLAFETMARRDPIIVESRERLARVQELLARPVTLRAPRLHVEPQDTARSAAPVLTEKPVRSVAPVLTEKPIRKNDAAKAVGPDGISYRRDG